MILSKYIILDVVCVCVCVNVCEFLTVFRRILSTILLFNQTQCDITLAPKHCKFSPLIGLAEATIKSNLRSYWREQKVDSTQKKTEHASYAECAPR